MNALELIKQAFVVSGIYAVGDTPSDDEANLALSTLNQMLSSWSLDGLSIYKIKNETFTANANTGSYTIGSGQTWSTTRPAKIVNAFARVNNIDYPLTIITNSEYIGLSNKTETASIPEYLYFDDGYPTGTIKLHPIPTQGMTIGLSQHEKLTTFALTDNVELPDGYEAALKYNLAIELAASWGAEPKQLVYNKATEYLANIKRSHVEPIKMINDAVLLSQTNGSFNITTGDME